MIQELITQLFGAVTGYGRNGDHRPSPIQSRNNVGTLGFTLILRQQISLIQNQPDIPGSQGRTELFQLPVNGADTLNRIRAIGGQHIHQVQ